MSELSDDQTPTRDWLFANGFDTEGEDGRPVYGRQLAPLISPLCPNHCCTVQRALICDFEHNCLFLTAAPPGAGSDLQIFPVGLPTVGAIKRLLAEPALAFAPPPVNLHNLN